MRMIDVLRSLPRAGLALGLAFLATACGEPSGGTATTVGGSFDAAQRVLELSGTASEMGRAQGRLLGARIRALHTRWREALWRDALGVAPDDDGPAAAALRSHIEDVVDAAAFRLPERVRQELDALAAEVGMEPLELIEVEVLRDALRMRGVAPRLRGALAAFRVEGGGTDVRCRWVGPDAQLLASELVWVLRRPTDGRPATLSLAWPGALGGLVVAQDPLPREASAKGPLLLVASADVEVPAPWRGFGHGLPFSVALRVAIEGGRTLRDVAGSLKGSVGHVALSVAMSGGDPLAVASTEAYLTPTKTVRVLDDTTPPALLVGPEADLKGEGQATFDAAASAPADKAWAAVVAALGEPSDAAALEVVLQRPGGLSLLSWGLVQASSKKP